jgi:[acyl-carrier-protein] S-malonyltransferase
MSTAYLFPGLNGLLRRADRNRYLHLPEVRDRLMQAEKVLRSRLGVRLSSEEFLALPMEEIYAIHNISLAAVIICAIQVGVTDRLKKTQAAPQWVMGCSLGDIARAVFSGAYDFEEAIYNHVHFTRSIDGIDKIGRNIGVATSRERPFTDEDFQWFDGIQVDVSRLTPRFLNIGGRNDDLKMVEARADERAWRVMPILDYPAHSRYILPYVKAAEADFLAVRTSAPQIPIFSSLSCRQLSDPEQIKEEFLLSITKTIHWHQAITALVKEHGVSRFVNIGPCLTLTRMMTDIDGSPPAIEASELV